MTELPIVNYSGVSALLAACGLLATLNSMPAAAQSPGSEATGVPKSAFYVGVGGSATFADFGTQSIYNKGISNVFNGGGVQTATGTADGPPIRPAFGTTAGFSPVFQLGYFRRFGESNFLWGTKFSYSYLGNNSTQQNLIIPQFGSSTAGGSSTFDGYSVTGGYTVGVYHQMSFTPFVGYALEKSFFYAGVGPSLSQVKTTLNNVVGYATIAGALTNISGTPQNFSTTSWVLGAAATVGVTYFLSPSWFVDFNYAFAAPNAQTIMSTSSFVNPGTGGGNSYTGTLIGVYTGNVVTHAIGITLNRAF
jgi:hypothetical protein